MWRFCAVTGGCDYVDARFFRADPDVLTLTTDVMGQPHMHWEGVLREDRPLDGESLMPRFRGEPRQGARRLFWLGRAMREGRWKLVEQKGKALLFDVAADIGEQRDVAAEHPARVAAMRKALAAWREEVK